MTRFKYIALILMIVLMPIFAISAQDTETFTFESGTSFNYPADATLDTSTTIPVLLLSETVIMDIVDPSVMGNDPDATMTMTLEQLLDVLLNSIGFEGPREEDSTFTFNLDDGREIMAYEWANPVGVNQSVLVMRLSDGRIGAFNLRSIDPITQELRTGVLEIANSFNSAGTDTAPSGDSGESAYSPEEEALMEGFTQEFAYPSGVGLRYPEGYLIVNEDNPPVIIGIDEVMLITILDPNRIGMPSGEEMSAVITFAIADNDILAEDFEPFDIGGREAVIASGPSDEFIQTLILVRFRDETVGILDILTFEGLTDELLPQVRGIAASFNSAGTESSTPSRDEIDLARTMFEDAMTAREEGNNEEALDLLNDALELDPELTLAIYWRAVVNQDMGNLEEALTGYQATLELVPDQVQIHNDIADTMALLGNMEGAVAELQAQIDAQGDAVDPQVVQLMEIYQQVADGEYVPEFYFRKANRLRQLGRYEDALATNDHSLAFDPENGELYGQRGVIYADMGQLEEALAAFTVGLEVDPLPILYYNRGFTYRREEMRGFNSMILGAHNLQCFLLLADDSVTEQQIEDAEQALTVTLISSDDYEEITDPAKCGPVIDG